MASKKKKKKKTYLRNVGTKRLSKKVAAAVREVVDMSGRTGALNGPVVNLYQEMEIPVGSHGIDRRLNPAQRVTLMAASPDLYRACYHALHALEGERFHDEDINCLCNQLENALGKAYHG